MSGALKNCAPGEPQQPCPIGLHIAASRTHSCWQALYISSTITTPLQTAARASTCHNLMVQDIDAGQVSIAQHGAKPAQLYRSCYHSHNWHNMKRLADSQSWGREHQQSGVVRKLTSVDVLFLSITPNASQFSMHSQTVSSRLPSSLHP